MALPIMTSSSIEALLFAELLMNRELPLHFSMQMLMVTFFIFNKGEMLLSKTLLFMMQSFQPLDAFGMKEI